MKKSPKIPASELILSAIFYLQHKNGVSANEITKYICEKRGWKQSQMKNEVKKALDRATKSGVFSKKRGLYCIENAFKKNPKSFKVNAKKRITKHENLKKSKDLNVSALVKKPNKMDCNFERRMCQFENADWEPASKLKKKSPLKGGHIMHGVLESGRMTCDDDEEEKVYFEPDLMPNADEDDDDDDFMEDEDDEDDDVDFFDDDQSSKPSNEIRDAYPQVRQNPNVRQRQLKKQKVKYADDYHQNVFSEENEADCDTNNAGNDCCEENGGNGNQNENCDPGEENDANMDCEEEEQNDEDCDPEEDCENEDQEECDENNEDDAEQNDEDCNEEDGGEAEQEEDCDENNEDEAEQKEEENGDDNQNEGEDVQNENDCEEDQNEDDCEENQDDDDCEDQNDDDCDEDNDDDCDEDNEDDCNDDNQECECPEETPTPEECAQQECEQKCKEECLKSCEDKCKEECKPPENGDKGNEENKPPESSEGVESPPPPSDNVSVKDEFMDVAEYQRRNPNKRKNSVPFSYSERSKNVYKERRMSECGSNKIRKLDT